MAEAIDFSYLGESVVPEDMGVPGSMLPVGHVGLKLKGWQWRGNDRINKDTEVAALMLNLEIVESGAYSGQEVNEDILIGQTENVQLGLKHDPYAQDPETVKRNMKVIEAICRAVGVTTQGRPWNQDLEEALERPFLGYTKADKNGYARLKNASEFDPSKVAVVDAQPQPSTKAPNMAAAPALGSRSLGSRGAAAPPAGVPGRGAPAATPPPAAGAPTPRVPGARK